MTNFIADVFNPELDLRFERMVDLSPEKLWMAWTTPELIKQWFCPLPWRVTECEIELRPGGRFNTVMHSPEGQDFPNSGCYLEVVENKRLIWTNAFLPGFRPAKLADTGNSCDTFAFTGIITFNPHPKGCLYQAAVLHADQAARDQHAAMGFEEGWGIALDQMIALLKAM